jgi:uncharacterized membrane protein YciS (DUF1049 family)
MAIFIVTLVLALLAAITAVVFAIGNPGVISVHFLSWSFDSSLTPLLLAAFALGLLLGWLITVPASIKKSLSIAGHKRKSESLEKQLPPQPEPPASTPTDPSEPQLDRSQ